MPSHFADYGEADNLRAILVLFANLASKFVGPFGERNESWIKKVDPLEGMINGCVARSNMIQVFSLVIT